MPDNETTQKLTVGQLIEILHAQPPDIPVAFVKWADAELYYIEGAETRQVCEFRETILTRDMEGDTPSYPVFVLSVLGE